MLTSSHCRLGPILFAIAALTFTACDDGDDGDDSGAGDADTDASAGSDTGADSDSGAESDSGADSDTGSGSDRPAEVEAVLTAIEDESYTQWEAEPEPHPPIGNSPHGEVRTFFNAALAESMGAGNTEHPVGAAAVKESWADGEIAGHFVEVKVAEGTGEETWYWWSDLAGVDDVGVQGCLGCHSAGVDYVTTPYPFE